MFNDESVKTVARFMSGYGSDQRMAQKGEVTD